MKIIFLDIDGVMDDKEYLKEFGYSHPYNDGRESDFSPRCVARLNWLIEKTGAKIVLSSSWRTAYYRDNWLEEVQTLMTRNGVIGQVVGITPRMQHLNWDVTRSIEILTWVATRPNIESWVAIDDETLFLSNFVQTSYPHCLSAEVAVKCATILNKKECGASDIRELTADEHRMYNDYWDSISTPVKGINFYDLIEKKKRY